MLGGPPSLEMCSGGVPTFYKNAGLGGQRWYYRVRVCTTEYWLVVQAISLYYGDLRSTSLYYRVRVCSTEYEWIRARKTECELVLRSASLYYRYESYWRLHRSITNTTATTNATTATNTTKLQEKSKRTPNQSPNKILKQRLNQTKVCHICWHQV